MVLIYAEKPDMAEKIASALGGSTFNRADKKEGAYKIRINNEEYKVTWGYGHLCSLAEAQDYNKEYKNWRKMPLPFIPDEFKIVANTKSKMPVKDTIKVVKQLFQESEYIINATDYDREGELIFYYLYCYLKSKKKVKRMKLSSTTKAGIEEAFHNMVDNTEVERIRKSAECRSIADWVVGCNLTAAMTLKAGKKDILSIGRVQTPTLAMVVARDEAIDKFKPEDYFTVDAVFTTKNGEKYKGSHKNKRFDKREDAEAVKRKCSGKKGEITKTEKTEKTKPVPNLYSLDSLQMDANSRYGYSLKRTLDLTQKLYEKGYVTYPRTDCQYLPEDMFPGIEKIQKMLKENGYSGRFTASADKANMQANRKRFFDDSKLGSHYAIIPTDKAASDMSPEEKHIYDLIAMSVIRMLYKDAKLENTKVVTTVNGEDFISSGTSIKEKGWMETGMDTKEELLPVLNKGDFVDGAFTVSAKKTEPPKHYTEKTLLAAMISAGKNLEDDELKAFMASEQIEGIGTVATRAGIIETLVNRGVITREKKNILSTQKGRELIHVVPVEAVKSAALTAQYEKKLNLIVKGQQDTQSFMNEIFNSTKEWCKEINNLSDERMKKMENSGNTNLICPVCGRPMNAYQWGYGCSGYNAEKNECNFSVGTICEKKLTESQVKTLIETGHVGPVQGFVSKKGTKFNASLKLEKEEVDGVVVNCRIVFEFEPKKESKKDQMKDVYARCPDCGGKIVRGNWGWECENKCGISVPYELCSRAIEPEQAEALFARGSTPVLEGFRSKKGTLFNAYLTLEDKKIKFVFPDRK